MSATPATLASEQCVELYADTSQALARDEVAPHRLNEDGRDDCEHLSLVAGPLPESSQ